MFGQGSSRPHRVVVAVVALSAALAGSPIAASGQPSQADLHPATLVRVYDGHQMEMAAGLELRADGRFSYGLSYGALDEEAEGSWTFDGTRVLLTSDLVTPPRFVLVDQRDVATGQLRIGLEAPHGLSRQYFHAEVRQADGRVTDHQLSDEQDPLEIGPIDGPATVTLQLPLFDLHSEPVHLAAGGHQVRFRFEPHDLGKVAFSRTPLRVDHGDLILERYDRVVRFRRTAG